MRFLATFALAASLTLGGCASLNSISGILSGATVTPQAVVIASNAVDAVEDTATAYLQLPRCRPNVTPICRVSAATQPIKRAVMAMRAARDDLKVWMRVHPNSAPPASLYEKVTAAVNLVNDVIAQYRIQPVAVR